MFSPGFLTFARRVSSLNGKAAGQTVLIRARLHQVRGKGKVAFIVLRQAFNTVQAVVEVRGEAIPKAFVKFAAAVPRESIVDVTGVVSATPTETKCTQSDVEIQVTALHVVSRAQPDLPFQIEDAMRPEDADDDPTGAPVARPEEEAGAAAASATSSSAPASAAGDEDADTSAPTAVVRVSRATRLDNRWIDLRVPANQAIMRISSAVCQLFRDYLLSQDFVEIQTPKLLAGASEGGAEVFKTTYFGEPACLAQSPQLYKQMCAACSDLERVFEIGPVFRAENSNTHRHLCEFHGLDLEMSIHEHYYEVLDVFSELFCYIFEGLETRYKSLLDTVGTQYPFEPFKYKRPAVRITFAEGIHMLQTNGYPDIDPMGDLSTELERALGRLVRAKYDTDFFMMDKYPLAIRPFYTMPAAEDETLSNSYDFFMRGEEILSGAQRVHDPELLIQRAMAKGVPVGSIKAYIDSFRHGAHPHGGGGVGLERVVMLYLGLGNIRKAAMFPRDPKRLSP